MRKFQGFHFKECLTFRERSQWFIEVAVEFDPEREKEFEWDMLDKLNSLIDDYKAKLGESFDFPYDFELVFLNLEEAEKRLARRKADELQRENDLRLLTALYWLRPPR